MHSKIQKFKLILPIICLFGIFNCKAEQVIRQQVDTTFVEQKDCTCENDVKKKETYSPPLKVILPYKTFVENTGWRFEQGEAGFNKVYVEKNLLKF